MLRSGLLLLLLAAAVPASAQLVPLTGYTYLRSPSSSYPDSGGTELRDGIDETIAWGGGVSISAAQVAPLVGWLNGNPSLRITWDDATTVRSVILWFADSDGAAGVGLPDSVTLATDTATLGTFTIADVPGAGSTVPITIGGLSLTEGHLRITANRHFQWTMLSEVQASTVIPEPAVAGMLFLAVPACLALLRRRR